MGNLTDKKLTDKEIIKALECCVLAKHICPHNCPMLKNKECLVSLRKHALDLINRKDAEIERLKENIESLQAENERLKGHQKDGFFNLLGNCLVFSKTLKDYNDMRKGLKAEAYKEFAERLKNEYSDFDEKNEVILPENIFKAIDDLLKELVGEDNG